MIDVLYNFADQEALVQKIKALESVAILSRVKE